MGVIIMVKNNVVPPEVMHDITNNGGITYKVYSYFLNNPDMMTREITELMINSLSPGKHVEASTIVKITPYLTIEHIHTLGEHIISPDVSNETYNFLNNLNEYYQDAILSMNEGLLRELIKNRLRQLESPFVNPYTVITPLFHIVGIEK